MADDEQPRAAPRDELRAEGHGTIAVLLGRAVSPRDVPYLCRRLRSMLARDGARLVVCDVGALAVVDLAVVDALGQLQLTARRRGREFRVRGATCELRALLVLTGLYDTVPLIEPGASLGPCGQAEQREQPRGVEKRVDPGDPAG